MSRRASPLFWAGVLGATGFAAGFFGPMLVNPEANQGPLVGILITGPGGAIAGLVLGTFFRILPFSDAIRGQALMLCAMVLGLGTLWFALPEPVVKARVVDATIGECRPARELIPARIAHWEERVEKVSYTAPRAGWRDTSRLLREFPGVVVELDVSRSNVVLQHRRPWNRGRLSAQGWKRIDDTQRFFGGGTCESYPRGKHVLLAPTHHRASNAWPPDDLPNFLGLQVLEAVPEKYRRVL